MLYLGGQSSFEHGHVESLKKIRWWTGISPRIFLKIQHVRGQKMIDPPGYDRLGSHLEFFYRFNMSMVKR